MKQLFAISLFLLLCVSPGFGQWSITSKATKPMAKQTRTKADDVWLEVMIRNDSNDTLYVQGIKWAKPWYMVEAYIKHSDDDVWERQNVVVDQELEMLPVKAGQEFKVVRREAKKSIGSSIMLTFRVAHSENESNGASILLGTFEIPEIKEREPGAQPDTKGAG